MERIKYIGKPFIKWAGGKSQLIPDLEKRLPADFGEWDDAIYVEPFVGGGAMLFWILQRYENITRVYINDINRRLITTYSVVKNNPEKLLDALEKLQREYLRMGDEERKEYYLAMRDKFNHNGKSDIATASLLIFLNRTCFNGLYRENAKGDFNVPHGRYKSPTICDEQTIMADSKLLQRVEIMCGDFSATLKYAAPHTLFYLDPPYKPLSTTSSFCSYSKDGFDDEEQIRLCEFCKDIERRGGSFILSNSDLKGANPENNFFEELYSSFSVSRVLATRMVNSNPERRGKLTELMVSNF